MNFRIADTFTTSLAKLNGKEQKAVKTTAFDLQMNPAHPGMSFHKLERAKDANFWSVRVTRDIRLIVHKTTDSLLLCYVDHHDKAYQWAGRRKLETHPKTGAAQLVEIRERVKEVVVPKAVVASVAELPALLFADVSDEALLSYGVPAEWLADVQALRNEDDLLALTDHLPPEAAEALVQLATGEQPVPVAPTDGTAPFEHPDAQRRFRVMNNVEELERALEFPWDKWTIFLHPAQREWVEKDYNGPARVSGSAGTGKTIVALHRAVHLARTNPDARILLTTFSHTLAQALDDKFKRLVYHQPKLAECVEVHSLDAVGERLYAAQFGGPVFASQQDIQQLLSKAASAHDSHTFSQGFLLAEWTQVVDAWQLGSWKAYRDVRRLGRKTRLPEAQRKTLWAMFDEVRAGLAAQGLLTRAELFVRLANTMPNRRHPPFDFAVVDEAQDISVAQLRFLAALGNNQPNSLFFAGDLGQRIFQQPFSWKALGVDVRGRSRTLHINYRTSHQIRLQADLLLDAEVADVDGNTEKRRGTVSVFNGVAPCVMAYDAERDEIAAAAEWVRQLAAEGVLANEIGVLVRSEAQLERAQQVVAQAGLSCCVLDDSMQLAVDEVAVGTMHLAKGLEFRAVVVMACDDEVVPLESRIEAVTEESDLKEVYETERHLLYVACTRARDFLWVSGVTPISEFLEDLQKI